MDALLGVSTYSPPKGYGPELGDASVERIRESAGGNLAQMPTTATRWYLKQLEDATFQADVGNLTNIAQLSRAMRMDGAISGLLRTRTSGVTRLPKKFFGNHPSVDELKSRNGSRSTFDDMIPPNELSMLDTDGIILGVGVAELVPVPGRDFPVMVRLEPEYLRYRWVENRWYYTSIAGLLPITPGDGRWVLHVPGARIAPWTSGLWKCLGRAYINKEHALMHRSNYSAGLANPARIAEAPQGATEEQRGSFLAKLMRWGTNTAFALPPGYQAKLLESNGRGFEVWQQEIDTCDREASIAIAGQVVTVDGGTGFSNQDVHDHIRGDIVKEDADQIAYTLNTQVLPPYIARKWGVGDIQTGAQFEFDVSRPKDMKDEAASIKDVSTAIAQLQQVLANTGYQLDLAEMTMRYGIPVIRVPGPEGKVLELRPSNNVKEAA